MENRPGSGPTLITGATGLLAPYIARAARASGAPVVTTSRSGGDLHLDLTDPAAVRTALEELRPTLVVHCAALTDVDRCERDPEEAFRLNCTATASLAELCPGRTRLVYVSTDQVYPDSPGPHRESAVGPVNVYGRSKLAGEEAALGHPRSMVLRVNFVGPSLTPGRSSLSDFIITSLESGSPLVLFDDVSFSPLHLETLAGIVIEASSAGLEGVFNIGAREGMTKAAFGLAVAASRHLSTDNTRIGTSSEIRGRAPRPHDLRMDVSRIEGTLHRSMPSVEEEILKL